MWLVPPPPSQYSYTWALHLRCKHCNGGITHTLNHWRCSSTHLQFTWHLKPNIVFAAHIGASEGASSHVSQESVTHRLRHVRATFSAFPGHIWIHTWGPNYSNPAASIRIPASITEIDDPSFYRLVVITVYRFFITLRLLRNKPN